MLTQRQIISLMQIRQMYFLTSVYRDAWRSTSSVSTITSSSSLSTMMETIKLHFSKQKNIFCQQWFVFVFFQAKSPQNYTLNDIGIINPDRLRRYLCCFSHLTHVQAYSWGRAFDTNLTHEVRITKVSLPNVCEREGTDLQNSADCRTLRTGVKIWSP